MTHWLMPRPPQRPFDIRDALWAAYILGGITAGAIAGPVGFWLGLAWQ